jgi:hypothetical protein
VASFNQIVKYLFAKEDAKLLHPMYVGTTTYQLILKKKKNLSTKFIATIAN